MANFGSLAAEIVSLVWGTPANFNGFRVLASLLQRRRSTEANQTLQDVWPSSIYTFLAAVNGIWHGRNFARCKIQFASSKSCALLLAVLLHSTRAVGASQTFAALSTGHHLYSARRPSRWALAHILVA